MSDQHLPRIGDVWMKCELCGKLTRFDDCEPDVDGDGSPGCPEPDCGGIVSVNVAGITPLSKAGR